jgi:hypothetical protein
MLEDIETNRWIHKSPKQTPKETENTINKQINELKMKIENIKEEVTHDMENLRKKNQTET